MRKRPLPRLPDTPPAELHYWEAIEGAFGLISIYDGAESYLSQRALLQDAPAQLLAAHWCSSEIENGGLHQFFSNPTAVLAPEAIQGLQLIGAVGLARLVSEAVESFGHSYPREQSPRRHRLQAMRGPGERREEWDPFYRLDDAYYALLRERSFAAHASAFVRGHLSLFFQTGGPTNEEQDPLEVPWQEFDLSAEAQEFLEGVDHEPVTLDDVANLPAIDVPRDIHIELVDLFDELGIDIEDRPLLG